MQEQTQIQARKQQSVEPDMKEARCPSGSWRLGLVRFKRQGKSEFNLEELRRQHGKTENEMQQVANRLTELVELID